MSAASTTSSTPQKLLQSVRRLPGARPAAEFARRDWVTDVWLVLVAFGLSMVALREYIAPDYQAEILPMLRGFETGGLSGAFDHLPGYPAAALIELIPAKIAMIFGASDGGVWRSISMFGIAAIALAVWSALPLVRGTDATRLATRLAVGLAVGSPCAYWALRIGHPEELFSTGFLVAAIVAAAKEKPVVAGLLLGLAVGKAWPAVAALPVLGLLLPDLRRVAVGAISAAAMVALFYVPSFLFAGNSVETLSNLGTHTIFNVGQIFWWFGTPIPEATVMVQPVPQPRVAPVWVGQVSHPLILGVGFALGLVWCWSLWQRLGSTFSVARLRLDGRTRSREEMAQLASAALLVCAGILYCRCFLDTWNVPYYLLPALVLGALGELLSGRPPMITLVASGIMWKWCTPGDLTVRSDPDIYTALYLGWTIPFGLAFLAMGMRAARRVPLVRGQSSGDVPAGDAEPASPDAEPQPA